MTWALRRRFQFEEMPPDPSTLKPVDDVDVALVLERLNSRLEWFLGPDQLIGHAWFIQAKSLPGPMQQLVTEYCWDERWNRPGLSRRDRSILNLGIIAALNRQHELRTHVRGALNNGLTKEEIAEVFLQVAIYCGILGASDSFRCAQQVLDETPG